MAVKNRSHPFANCYKSKSHLLIHEQANPITSQTCLAKAPTRTETTQRNHFFASVCAYVKLESVKLKTGVNQFVLKSKFYAAALKTAYQELVKPVPVSLGA